jgi:hypothetical protein
MHIEKFKYLKLQKFQAKKIFSNKTFKISLEDFTLIYQLKSTESLKYFWHFYAFGCLVVFQNSCQYSRQGQCGAI